ncbi:hypothetical protein GIB67_012388 [Kingdonia uniflora]|uniref:Uncharacterized protein n=1 Tax=Kingdonia uniflora TaxID=39325 RepID=A0A7J7LLZ4_9MAGN|nr:hypothetical protein GIB67_012388 [Kingdonia uniflora]
MYFYFIFKHTFLKAEHCILFAAKKTPTKKSKSSANELVVGSGEEMSPKDKALQAAIDQITTSFGSGAIMWLGRSRTPRHVPVVSTGSFTLDSALGVGGLPKGRVVEIYGPEASGKTTLALHVIAESQKQGGYCVFVDAEHALDPNLAESVGVNIRNVLLSQPDSGEQALSLVDTMIRSGSVDVVVVDSVAALVPKGELDGEMGDAHMAMQARLMSQALRKLCHSLSMSQTILIFINQIRSKLTSFGGFGPQETTSGGNALKFYASVRLNIRRTGWVKKGEEIVGSEVQVKIVKNKLAPPFKIANFEIRFGKGISRAAEIVEFGLKHNFIEKGGGAFLKMNDKSFQGKDKLRIYLEENDDVREELETKIHEILSTPEPVEETELETSDEELNSDGIGEVAAAAML